MPDIDTLLKHIVDETPLSLEHFQLLINFNCIEEVEVDSWQLTEYGAKRLAKIIGQEGTHE